jgi:hypothetical protein
MENPVHPTSKLETDFSRYVIEDDEPVEGIYFEKLGRLLAGTLYESWSGPGPGRPFIVASRVGLFGILGEYEALRPDVMLAVDVQFGDISERCDRSYFTWVRDKPPDVVIDFISERRLGMSYHNPANYARIGVPYYVSFDPDNLLRKLRSYVLKDNTYEPLAEDWYPETNLGLTLWSGRYEDMAGDDWLRWCDLEGQVIPTAVERTQHIREHADQERQVRERLEAKFRALGIDPNA